MRTIPINPVLARELKERVRGRRAAVIITLYLAVLSGLLWVVYESSGGSTHNEFGQPVPTQLAEVGYRIFDWVMFAIVLVVLFLVPAQSASAIAGERERQTLVPLQITLLSPTSILAGKILASMAFLGLLLVAAVPVMSVAYLIGGVTIGEVLVAVAVTLAVGVCIATMCAAISTFAKRVQSATVLSYGLVLFLVIGSFAAFGGAAAIDSSRGIDDADPPNVLLLFNPLATIGDLVGRDDGSTDAAPLDGIRGLVHLDDDRNQFDGGFARFEQGFGIGEARLMVVDGNGELVAADRDDGEVLGLPFWSWSLFFLGGLALTTLLLAARRLRTPAARDR